MPKHGLRAFGLAIMAALGLMAFFSVTAQAEELTDGGKAGKFLIEKKGFEEKLDAKFTGAQESATGVLTVPGRKLAILCTVGRLAEGLIKNETDAHAKVEFEKCSTWVNVELVLKNKSTHTKPIPCTVNEPIVAKALALPKKHNSEPYVLFEPLEGTTFTTIILEGAECPLPLENPVTGSVVAKVLNNDTIEPLLLFEEEYQKLMGDKLFYGKTGQIFEGYLEGSAKGNLIEKHLKMTLGVS